MTTEPPTNEEYRAAAKKQYEKEGTIEIDDGAEISRAHEHPPGEACNNADEDGAYVQAWVWVENPREEAGPA